VLVVVVRLAYLVQPRLRRNGHSHDVEMRSGRHAVPLDIRGSGSFLYNLFLLDVSWSDVVIIRLPCPLFTVDKDGFNHTTQQLDEFSENAASSVTAGVGG
jgi:hypothetical protein